MNNIMEMTGHQDELYYAMILRYAQIRVGHLTSPGNFTTYQTSFSFKLRMCGRGGAGGGVPVPVSGEFEF